MSSSRVALLLVLTIFVTAVLVSAASRAYWEDRASTSTSDESVICYEQHTAGGKVTLCR